MPMTDNICRFVPSKNDYDNINTVNFVYETTADTSNKLITHAYYTAYLVISGTATLFQAKKSVELNENDVFFTFPTVPFSLHPSDKSFKFIYISFMGIRAGKLLEKLKITPSDCVFGELKELSDFWMNAINISTQDNLAILSESVLLYTLSLISNHIEVKKELSKEADISLKIKKYIDDNYTSSDMSLETLARLFKYNQKYISAVLKKSIGVGFAQYLKTLRIQHACMLINEGFSNIKDIAYMSGYNDALYFSKVFKKTIGKPPKEYIAEIRM